MSTRFFLAIFPVRNTALGVTPPGHLQLLPKLPPKSPAAPDPRRSLATIVCRPIRVRYTGFSGVFTRMSSLPDRPRPSQISGPALHRINAPIGLFYRHLLNSIFAVTQEVTHEITRTHGRFDFVASEQWKVRLGPPAVVEGLRATHREVALR